MIFGEQGNDVLIGGAGNDRSWSATTARDTMRGGAGNDTIDGGDVTDHVNYTDRNVLTYLRTRRPAIRLDFSRIAGDGI